MRDIPNLTGLRGLAALIVFISHAANSGYLPSVFGRGFGQIGVMMFFVLSGFLMAYLYGNRALNRFSLASYATARIGRVVPLYLVVVVSSFVLSRWVLPEWHYNFSSIKRFLAAAFLIQANEELWTIPVEVQFYVVFVGLWFLRSRNASIWALIGFAVLTVVPTIATLAVRGVYFNVITTYSPAFFLGAFIGLNWNNHIRPWLVQRERAVNTLAPIFAVLLFLNLPELRRLTGTSLSASVADLIWLDPLHWLVVVGFFLCSAAEAKSLRFLATKALLYIGSISYCLYLIHAPLMEIAIKRFGNHPIALVGLFIFTVLLCHLSMMFLERPMAKRIRRIVPVVGRPMPA